MSSFRTIVDGLVRKPWRAFVLIFLLAFLVRLVLLVTLTSRIHIYPERFSEIGAVALNLVENGCYADPYEVPTGPTSHPLPLYTFLLAGLYKVLGVTMTAGYVRCVLHIASYATMYALMPWFAGKLGAGRQAGLIGGLAGAVVPYRHPARSSAGAAARSTAPSCSVVSWSRSAVAGEAAAVRSVAHWGWDSSSASASILSPPSCR